MKRYTWSTDELTHLLLSNEWTPKHAHTLTNHRHLQFMILLEPIHHFLQRRIIPELETIPQRPFRLAILLLRRSYWLREAEEW